MELEALQEIHSEVRALGAQIVVLTPELQLYTRALHKKLSLAFDIVTDLHLKIAEQVRLVSLCRITYAIFTNRSVMPWTGSTMSRNTDCRYRHDTSSTSKGSFVQRM